MEDDPMDPAPPADAAADALADASGAQSDATDAGSPLQSPLAPSPGPRPRLVIQSLVLENFKSYGGTVKIGPFHKCFSSIVGPNGSGKSNVIDAMLFVFGRRAKQLRHSKMSELLHHSQTHPNVTSGSVTVNFHEIIDTGDGDDDYEVVPGSEFGVARKAFKNNTSKYYLRGKEVQMKQVIALLKGKGVDLDNNRFLILQGEVEQIAMMKPKAVNAHEDGLLEYLEDIIGSNRYVEEIDSSAARVETLNEERTHKLNRVKVVQKERDGLESAKTEAEGVLEKTRQLETKRAALLSARIAEQAATLKSYEEKFEEEKTKHKEAQAMMKEKEGGTKELEQKFKSTKKETDAIAKKMNSAKEEFAAFERVDIEIRENLKALKASRKKLEKAVEREEAKKETAEADVKKNQATIAKAEKACKKLEESLKKAEAKLEKVHRDIRDKTEPIREQIEAKQTELLPLTDTVNKCKQDLDVAMMELKLLTDKRDAPAMRLAEEEEKLVCLKSDLKEKISALSGLRSERESVKDAQKDFGDRTKRLEGDVKAKGEQVAELRGKVEEARAANDDSSSRSDLQAGLAEAAQDGLITGIVGRLGDLASVDKRYDVAVGAAVGARLDNIVVRTAESAQACIGLLKRKNLGVATFVILDKIQNLRDGIERWEGSSRSADGPRLFDKLDIPQEEHCVALYHALRDTLVAESIEDARRMAFKPSRKNRVVTMTGELIEDSGAMSGGGKAPSRFRLGGGKGNAFDADPQALSKAMEQLDRAQQELNSLTAELDVVRKEAKGAQLHEEKMETDLRMAEMDVKSLKERVENINSVSLPDLRKAVAAAKKDSSGSGAKHIKELEKKTKGFEKQLNAANRACEGIQTEIADLQEEIVAAGGKKLQDANENLKNIREERSDEKRNLSKATSRADEAEKSIEKATKAQEKLKNDLEANHKEKEHSKERLDRLEGEALDIDKAHKELMQKHEEWQKMLDEVSEEVAEVKESLKELRREEVSLGENVAAAQRDLKIAKLELSDMRKWHKQALKKLANIHKDIAGSFGVKEEETLEPMEVDGEEAASDKDLEEDGDGEEKEEEEEGDEVQETPTHEGALSAADKSKLEREIASLQSEIGDKRPDLRAIAEYQKKESECAQHGAELDTVTLSRDDERKKCDKLRKQRLDEFMSGFSTITLKLKELYQMITLGGDAELELVDSLDPFSDGILFSVRPPKKSWKNISNLSGGEKTLSSLALVFALHHFKPTPLYFLDEIDAALDFKNVSIVANYVKERTKNAQFIIISLRNNMFELADRLVGIYKTHHSTKSVTVNPRSFVVGRAKTAQSQV